VAETLHGKTPGFVPPFPGSVAKYLSPKSAFNRVHGRIHPFIATRDDRPVGRIAAVVYDSHNERYADKTGFFGFFECEDNPETARALFERAAATLREHGLTSMRGPYNPSINDECGVLVWEGGEQAPCVGLTWNPAYYESLVFAAGLGQIRELVGFDLPMDRLVVPERLKRLGDRAEKRAKLRLRPIDLKNLEKELEIVHEVYNDTLSRNWGFVPISMEDLLGAADDMRAFADPNIILIAEKDGEPAGVALTLPDFNQILAGLQRVPHWLRLPVILWRMKTRKITACRQMVYGVLPKFRDHGLHAWLLREQFSEAKKRYPFAELGWMEANNEPIFAACKEVGGFHNRTWRIYERSL
jgi:hypothetical protein